MKLIITIYILSISISAISQTAGVVKWKTADGVNYSYSGELKNGKPEGIGVVTGDNDSTMFGHFLNGGSNGQMVALNKTGTIRILNFENGKAKGPVVIKGKDDLLLKSYMINGKIEGLAQTIASDGAMGFSRHVGGEFYGRQLLFPSDRSHIMAIEMVPWRNQWYGFRYDFWRKELKSGLWNKDLSFIENANVPFYSFLQKSSFEANQDDKQLVVSERLAADGNRIQDTCIVYNKLNGYCYFGRYENGQMVSGMLNLNNKVKAFVNRSNKMWNGFCTNLTVGEFLYEGDYLNDKRHGDGILITIPESGIYFGQFKNDKVEGEGAMYFDKKVMIGSFRDGQLDGYGKVILEDGQKFEGFFSKGTIAKLKTADGDEIFVSPAKFDEVISFLLKDWENNFSTILFNRKFDPGVKSATWSVNAKDCIYQIPVYGYARWILPDQKGKDGKLRNEFVFTVSDGTIKSADFLQTIYNDIFSKLKACELTNLAPGKKLKLIPPVNGKLPANLNFKKFECLFTVPAYPGKKADPIIRLMVENLNGEYYITVTIKGK